MQLSKIEVDKQQREIIKYENGDFPFLIFTDDFVILMKDTLDGIAQRPSNFIRSWR